MALIPQVKCSRCDRKYSGLRTRCPYCGTRRYQKSAKAVQADNSTWKVIVGIILLVVLIAAVVVLIVTSVNDSASNNDNNANANTNADSNGVSSVEGNTPTGGDTQTTTPPDDNTQTTTPPDDNTQTTTPPDDNTQTTTPPDDNTQTTTPPEENTPQPAVNSVYITYGKNRVGQVNSSGQREFTLGKSEGSIQLGVKISPEGLDVTPVWESSNESVFIVNQSGKVTWVGKGSAILRVTVDGVPDEVLVRCN